MASPDRKSLAWGAAALAAIVVIGWGAILIVGATSPTEEPYIGQPSGGTAVAPGASADRQDDATDE